MTLPAGRTFPKVQANAVVKVGGGEAGFAIAALEDSAYLPWMCVITFSAGMRQGFSEEFML